MNFTVHPPIFGDCLINDSIIADVCWPSFLSSSTDEHSFCCELSIVEIPDETASFLPDSSNDRVVVWIQG